MKKNFWKMFLMATVATVFFTSCQMNSEASILIRFDASSLARSGDYALPEAGCLVVSISGDYTASQMIVLGENDSPYNIRFDSVPVGADIVVEANIYRDSGGDYFYYREYIGCSDEISVMAGTNPVSIKLEDVADVNSDGARASSYLLGQLLFTFCISSNTYSNGKYEYMILYQGSELLSEGTVEIGSDTITIKEYVYQDFKIENDRPYFSTTGDGVKIVENPKTVTVKLTKSTEENASVVFKSFPFTFQNGTKLEFTGTL